MTKDSFISNFMRRIIDAPQNIIIDEMGLVGLEFINWCKENIPHCRIHALGDDLQLINKNDDQFNPIHYNKVFGEDCYPEDFRSKC